MRRFLLATLLASGGCDQVFGLGNKAPSGAGSDSATDSAAAQCPAEFAGSRYLINTTPMLWREAEAFCVGLDTTPADAPHTHLAVINTLSELTLMPIVADDTYVGYTDRKQPGVFVWITDEATDALSLWASGEPASGSPPPSCAAIQPSATLDAHGCDQTAKAFMCECDAFAEDPTKIYPVAR